MKKTIITTILAMVTFTMYADLPAPAVPRPTGTFVLGTPNTTNCLTGFTCNNYTVTSPDTGEPRPVTGVIARWQAANSDHSKVIVFIGGHAGNNWWGGNPTAALAQPFFQKLHDAGYDIIQMRWNGNGWPHAAQLPEGFVRLACRPATFFKWVHDSPEWYNERPHSMGQVGFAVVGSSEGSAAVGWSLAAYQIGDIVDAAFIVSGPPMGDMADGCMDVSGYTYVPGAEKTLIDQPYGFASGTGPCYLKNSTWINSPNGWVNNSVESIPNGRYLNANTRMHFIFGSRDAITIKNHALAYFNKVSSVGQPMLTWTLVPTMPHPIIQSQAGLDVLYSSLTQ